MHVFGIFAVVYWLCGFCGLVLKLVQNKSVVCEENVEM